MFTCSCICMSLCLCVSVYMFVYLQVYMFVSLYMCLLYDVCAQWERDERRLGNERGICISMQRHGKEGRVLWFCLIVDLCSQDLNLPHIESAHRNLQYVLRIYNYLILKERVVDEFVNVNNIRIHFYLVFSRI